MTIRNFRELSHKTIRSLEQNAASIEIAEKSKLCIDRAIGRKRVLSVGHVLNDVQMKYRKKSLRRSKKRPDAYIEKFRQGEAKLVSKLQSQMHEYLSLRLSHIRPKNHARYTIEKIERISFKPRGSRNQYTNIIIHNGRAFETFALVEVKKHKGSVIIEVACRNPRKTLRYPAGEFAAMVPDLKRMMHVAKLPRPPKGHNPSGIINVGQVLD